MTWIDIKPASSFAPPAPAGIPFFRLGFRVFFFLAALGSILSLLAWVPVYSGWWGLQSRFIPMQWHAREMIFGFTSAVIAGFLLTAAGNWTGAKMPSGAKLGVLGGLWILGRITPLIPALPSWFAAGIDTAFFFTTAAVLAAPILKTRQIRNAAFPAFLIALGLANLFTYTGLRNGNGLAVGTEAGLGLCLLVVAKMGGRVIPGFTRGRLPDGRSTTVPWIEQLAVPTLALALAGRVAGVHPAVEGILFALATILHALRLGTWFTPGIHREPLLWILHAAYAWLVLGLALHAAAAWGLASPLPARHAFGAGALGNICLGMMCRVSLGHTGRPLTLPKGNITAFFLLQITAILRVLLPLCFPTKSLIGIQLSALTWTAAFGIYLVQYGPMLFKARVDGKDG